MAKEKNLLRGIDTMERRFCSIIIAVSSVVYGVFAMMEKEKNYLLFLD